MINSTQIHSAEPRSQMILGFQDSPADSNRQPPFEGGGIKGQGLKKVPGQARLRYKKSYDMCRKSAPETEKLQAILRKNLQRQLPQKSTSSAADQPPPPLWGGVNQGRFVILRFHLFCSVWGCQDNRSLGERQPESVIITPLFVCASNASKN